MSLSPESLKLALRLKQYREDFPLFAREQLKIQTKAALIQPFILKPFQRRLYTQFEEQRRRTGMIRQLILKSRQIGSSTLSQGLIFWRTVLNPNINSLVIAHDVGTSQLIFTMAKRFYENLDKPFQPMVRYSTRQEIFFDNPSASERAAIRGLNSRVTVATARNIHSGAGGTLHCVHLSEAARYPNAQEIESATLQAVAAQPGTIVIIESTARPEGYWFRLMCDRAREGKSHFECSFVPWVDDLDCVRPLLPGEALDPDPEEKELMREYGVTGEQLKFRREKIEEKLGNVDEFNMDYPLTYEEAWITREFNVFPPQHLRKLGGGIRPPLYRGNVLVGRGIVRDFRGDLAVWEDPQPQAGYDIGVDVAMGVGQDSSVIQVLKRPHGTQVAEYASDKVDPGDLVGIVEAVGRFYNLAQVAVEVNGPGLYTNSELGRIYPNMYIWRKKDKIKNQLSTFFGWETQRKSKKWIVSLGKDRLYRYVQSNAMAEYPLIRSEMLMKELSVFVQDPGTEDYHAAPGPIGDDRVMAWLIALNASHDEYGMEMEALGEPETDKDIAREHKLGCVCKACEPRLWLGEDESFMARTHAHESDAWDARGWRT